MCPTFYWSFEGPSTLNLGLSWCRWNENSINVHGSMRKWAADQMQYKDEDINQTKIWMTLCKSDTSTDNCEIRIPLKLSVSYGKTMSKMKSKSKALQKTVARGVTKGIVLWIKTILERGASFSSMGEDSLHQDEFCITSYNRDVGKAHSNMKTDHNS